MGYCKILIISPGPYFWSEGLFEKIFLVGLIFRGGRGGLYMDEYLHFENAIFIEAVVIF